MGERGKEGWVREEGEKGKEGGGEEVPLWSHVGSRAPPSVRQ